MWRKWIPWRYVATRLARANGFLDPLVWMQRMRSFSQPSEVSEPIELLRAGVLFHARGLINTKAIQHNLDWVWPFWVERQFNPSDESFIPRAFSFSHINLTHRNWTAVGDPNLTLYPIVDPRGLVTPFFDGWSLDFWLIPKKGNRPSLLPSKEDSTAQRFQLNETAEVVTEQRREDMEIKTCAFLRADDAPSCVVSVEARSGEPCWLAVAVRPYNPEGISFIDRIESKEEGRSLRVNDHGVVRFERRPDRIRLSNYRNGDVYQSLFENNGPSPDSIQCPVAMASGAAVFSVDSNLRPMEVTVPLIDEMTREPAKGSSHSTGWSEAIAQCGSLEVSDPLIQRLYDNAVASLILFTSGDVYPGPYTYKRFWYRDAAFILNALITLGAEERTRRALDRFPDGQTAAGYFRSQDGEWDSNGEVLWIWNRYLKLAGAALPEAWRKPARKGAEWIQKKRLPLDSGEPHAGLLPAGFSAEHLGPNDFYYWDDFWGVAGLRAAAAMLQDVDPEAAKTYRRWADDFTKAIVASFRHIPERRYSGGVTASPHRRMDSGAVGSLVADYPLQLFQAGDDRILKTVDYLLDESCYEGGFFQSMIHSGVNAYLTLHLAQVLMRAGDWRARDLIGTVAELASPTGQWPEAIHPRTGGGCMGDGQHIWAAAEWLMAIRNSFVLEEGERLVIGAGVWPAWMESREPIYFGPTLTPHGPVSVRMTPQADSRYELMIEGQWRGEPPNLTIALPGCAITGSGENRQGLYQIERIV